MKAGLVACFTFAVVNGLSWKKRQPRPSLPPRPAPLHSSSDSILRESISSTPRPSRTAATATPWAAAPYTKLGAYNGPFTLITRTFRVLALTPHTSCHVDCSASGSYTLYENHLLAFFFTYYAYSELPGWCREPG